MSRIIQLQTEMTDLNLATTALESAGIAYTVNGDIIRMLSGDLNNATIDLKSGRISGDSDFKHTSYKFGMLRQHYSEAQVREAYAKEGTQVDERATDTEGNIVLMWHTA